MNRKKELIIILFILLSNIVFCKEIDIYPELTDFYPNKTVCFYNNGNNFITSSIGDKLEVWSLERASLDDYLEYVIPEDYNRSDYGNRFQQSTIVKITSNDEKVFSIYNEKSSDTKDVLAIFDTKSGDVFYSSTTEFMFTRGDILTDVALSADNQLFATIGHSIASISINDEPTSTDPFSDLYFNTFQKIDEKKVKDQEKGTWYVTINQINKNTISTYKSYFFPYDLSKSNSEIGLKACFNPLTRTQLAIGTTNGAYVFNIEKYMSERGQYSTNFIDKEIKCGCVNDIKYSTDGKWLILTDDSNINIYDSTNYRLIKRLRGGASDAKTFAINSDNSYLIVAYEDGSIVKWDIIDSRKLFEVKSSSTKVTSIDINNQNRILLATSDGKIQLIDDINGNEIISFISFNNKEWISITPDGYYNSSANGDEYINIRNGMIVYPISQFNKSYNHPEVLYARIYKIEDPAIVNYYGDIRLSDAPPVVSVNYKANILDDNGVLEVKILDPAMKSSIGKIRLYRNGSLLDISHANVSVSQVMKTQTFISNSNNNVFAMDLTIPTSLENGNNNFEVIVENDFCYGVGTYKIKNDTEKSSKMNLYVLSIGIDDYPAEGTFNDLYNAVTDSERICKIMKSQVGKRFNNVFVKNISDKQDAKPTYENCIDGFSFFETATENDVCLLYIASHGINIDDHFYIIPNDCNEKLESYISIDNILERFDVLGKKIVMLDTCQSGAIKNNMVVRTLKDKSCSIFYAASDNEYAKEIKGQGGIFTISIQRCLETNTHISLNGLAEYIYNYVTQESKINGRGIVRQHPDCVIPESSKDFILFL